MHIYKSINIKWIIQISIKPTIPCILYFTKPKLFILVDFRAQEVRHAYKGNS